MKIRLLLFVAILLTACHRPKGYSKEWVDVHIKPDMTKDQVISVAGKPLESRQLDARRYSYTYKNFVTPTPDHRTQFNGFVILFTDDKVTAVYPIYAD